jgi:hypothetical protein
MHGWKKLWPLVALGVLVAGFFGYRYVLSSMLSFDCVHRVLSETASPDGQYIATVSERGCGAVAHDYRVVSVRRRGTQFDGENKKSWVFWMENHPEIKADWSGQRQLSVLYSSTTGKKGEIAGWEDVTITSKSSH